VSRSFYLSIRLLPPGLRQPIAVAYLLARATDTLADTSALPAAQRADLLSALAACIQHQPGDSTAVLGRINTTFAPLQHDPAEKALLADLPQCLAWLAALPANDQADIRTVLRHITQGQTQDIATFGEANQGIRALANAAEVEDYTYRVAGCVGEFWTTLCFRHLEGFATLPQAQMQALGRRYGMGLQRINILRDLQADLAAGRCYLPADALAAVGLAPADLRQPPEVFGTVYRHWLTETQALLDDGLAYALAVNPRRVRAASALPALVGARTLALLAAAGPVAQPIPVKMPRREMRGLMLRLALSLAGRGSLRGLYQRLSAPLPMGQSHA
jgi:farnesyl-diphosphate farnesyltransferase